MSNSKAGLKNFKANCTMLRWLLCLLVVGLPAFGFVDQSVVDFPVGEPSR
jgi:hypothetical protein